MSLEQFDDRLFAATLTPYRPGTFDVDESGYRRLIARFVAANGPREKVGVIAIPEAGEIFYLTPAEKRRIVEIALEEADGRIPVIAGVSENRTEDAAKASRELAAMGVDGLFVLPPVGAIDVTSSWDASAYPEVYIDLLRDITDAAPELPIVAHPIGGATATYGIGFPADATIAICTEIPNVVGWKMTYHYNGFRKIVRALRGLDRHVRLYPSSAPFYHEYLASDYLEGAVTGSLNYALDPMLEHIAAWREGDIEKAKRIWLGGLAELHEYVYLTYSRLHVKYKLAAWLAGEIDDPVMRPPVPGPRRSEIVELKRLLEGAGIATIGDAEIRRIMESARP